MKAALVGLALLGFTTAASPEGYSKQCIDAVVRPLLDSRKNLGVVVGILSEGATQVFAYGSVRVDEDAPPTGDTLFEIGSITKVFTGILLARMAQEELVSIDDPVRRFLPETVSVPKSGTREITLRHLVTHTSGLPRMPDNFSPADSANPYADYSEELLYAFLRHHTLRRQPGAMEEYSNLGMGLLGHALCRAERKTWEDLVVSKICHPLGMKDTRVTLTSDQGERLSPGHVAKTFLGIPVRFLTGGDETAGGNTCFRPTKNWDLPILAGAGALRSTVNDLLLFARANVDCGTNDWCRALEAAQQPLFYEDDNNAVGMGWQVRLRGNRSTAFIWHNGGTGGYRSFLAINRSQRTAVVILSNTSTSSGVDEEAVKILEMLH